MARIGGFRGFGGQFVSPPELGASGGQLYAFDRDCCWSIHADCFGATLRRFGPNPPADIRQPEPAILSRQGDVCLNGCRGNFPVLREWTSFAAAGPTLAVGVERSHRIYLVALLGGGGD
jgi:hypothetical protein